jgi:hypothetical protein
MRDLESILCRVTHLITGKRIRLLYSEDLQFIQDQDTIGITSGEGNLLLVIHEIGHWLAATPEERLLHNLGLVDDLTQHAINREIQAREISNFIFKDWIRTRLGGQEQAYAEYLTTRIFSQFESDYTDPIIDDAWICAKLEQAGVDLVQVNHLLWEKPNTFIYPIGTTESHT